MKKILCLTDFSVTAEKAVRYAAWVAQRCQASLTLLHVLQLHLLDNEKGVPANSQTVSAQKHMAERTLHDTCAQLQEKFKGDDKQHPLPCDALVKEGLLREIVPDLCEKGGYDFIVLGTTGGGADRLEDLILGSNTVQVFENVKCPVLAIPSECTTFNLEKIVYATDYHEKDQLAIQSLIPIATCFNSQIHVVHVDSEKSRETEEKFGRFCRPLARDVSYDKFHFAQIQHTDPEEGILTFVKQTHSHMIAMLAKEPGFFRKYFHQSLTEQIAYHSKVPFLVLHEEAL